MGKKIRKTKTSVETGGSPVDLKGGLVLDAVFQVIMGLFFAAFPGLNIPIVSSIITWILGSNFIKPKLIDWFFGMEMLIESGAYKNATTRLKNAMQGPDSPKKQEYIDAAIEEFKKSLSDLIHTVHTARYRRVQVQP